MRPFLLIALLLVTACENISRNMASFVGKPDALLLGQWGAPDRETTTYDGKRILTYNGRDGNNRIACAGTFTVWDGIVQSWTHNC